VNATLRDALLDLRTHTSRFGIVFVHSLCVENNGAQADSSFVCICFGADEWMKAAPADRSHSHLAPVSRASSS